MDNSEIVADIIRMYQDADGRTPLASEVLEDLVEFHYERGYISEGEIDLAYKQFEDEVKYLMAGLV